MEPKRLYRSRQDRIFLGVCGGLGEYFEIDSIIFRGLFLLLTLGGGAGIILYFLLAILVPNAPLAGQPAPMPGIPNTGEDFKNRVNDFAQELRQNAQNLAEEIKNRPHSQDHSARYILGLFIIIFGAAWLMQNVFPQPWFRWDVFWPAIVIFFGILVLMKKR